ncbi:MAG TPA: DNA polymerase IV, partial [Gammaproteobacteria bacterium]|nr:DNA polymerase IV [Gammaproteobacteria bacterium]
YLQHMSEKVGARLRKHDFKSSAFFIGLKSKNGWIGSKLKLAYSIDDGIRIMKLGEEMMRHKWHGEGIHQIQVTALNPQKLNQQIDFLEQDSNANISVKNKVIDLINEKYGNLTIAPSNIMNRSTMPDVIAPAWKPSGHRQTI